MTRSPITINKLEIFPLTIKIKLDSILVLFDDWSRFRMDRLYSLTSFNNIDRYHLMSTQEIGHEISKID